jgi:hypothetical protein
MRWKGVFLDRPSRLSAEDQYLTEGHWHVERRNRSWSAGDFAGAWYENLILERYFAPVLDTPSYVDKAGHRWSPEHRADAERHAAAPARRYESRAHPSEIFVWPTALYWTLVLAVAGLLAGPWVFDRLFRNQVAPPAPDHTSR